MASTYQLNGYAAYVREVDESLTEKFWQFLELNVFSALNSQVTYDIGNYVAGSLGTFWTAADSWLTTNKYSAMAPRTTAPPKTSEVRTTRKMRDRSAYKRHRLTTGISKICDDPSWSKENSAKTWSVLPKTRTDRVTSPANSVCARQFRARSSFHASVVTVGVLGFLQFRTNA